MSAGAIEVSGAEALAALPVALMGFSAEGQLSLVNAEMLALLGMDKASLPLGAQAHEVLRRLAFHGTLGAGDPELRLREVLALDPGHAHRRLLRDATGRGLELRLAPLPGGGRLLTIADVTGLLRARETAETQARAASDVLSRLGTGIAQYDADHRLTLSNPAYARLIGLDPAALSPGMTVPEVVQRQQEAGEFDAETARSVIARMAAYPKGLTWRMERTRPDGRTLRFENQIMPDGGWLAEITDVSEKHATEQDARRRIALHDAMMQALPVGVAVYAADRTCTMVNPAYNRIMTRSPISVGENLRDILMRRAIEGEFGPLQDVEAEVHRRLTLVAAPYAFEQRVAGVSTAHRSVPLPDGGHAMVVADVTALVAAQTELRDRAELFQVMLESTRHGIAMFDSSSRVVAANRLAARLCGIPAEKFVPGITLEQLREMQLAHGTHGDRDATESFLAARRGQELKGPDRYRRRDRHGSTIEVATDQLADGGFVRSYTDVTAQVAAETEAMDRAATLQTVLDNMRHGILLYDEEGRLLASNELTAQLTGLPLELLTPGANVGGFFDAQVAQGEFGSPEETEAFRQRQGPNPWRTAGRYTRRRPNGTVTEIRTHPVPGGGWIRSFTDITALTHAQEEAAKRAAMMQAMLDNMRHGIALFDAERRLLAANGLCGEMMGIGSALRPGMMHGEILEVQAAAGEFGSKAEADRYIRETVEGDWGRTRHASRRRPDGTELEVVTSPVPGGGFVLTLTDVTARMVAEREVKRRAEVLATTLNATRQGITLYDSAGRVVAGNDIAARMAGFPDGLSLVGRQHIELLEGHRVIEGITVEQDAPRRAFYQAMDRRQRQRYQRRRTDGTVLDVISDPTADGGYIVSTSDVTELVLAREQAQAQAAALSATLDASRHTIILYGPDHRVVATNRINLDLTGFATVEEMVGKTYEEVITNQARKDFGENYEWFVREMMAVDRTKTIRYQRRLADGRVRDVASDPTPDGGFVVSVSDVTELVDAREEAQRRAGILQVMLDNNRQGIALYDSEQRLIAANKLAGQLMGVPELVVPGVTQRELLAAQRARGMFAGPDDDGEAWERLFVEMDRRRPHRTQRNLPDGRRLDISSDPTPHGGHVVSIADITPLVRAEEAAQQRAGVLKTMLENNTSGIMLYGADRRLVAANALAAELTEVDLQACIGRTLEENLTLQLESGNLGKAEEGQRNLERLIDLDRRVTHRNQRLARDGRVLIVSTAPTPDGGFVISQTDVTAVVRAEAEAARRAEILGVMLGNIRHGIVLFDRTGHVVASNAKLHEMLELPESLLTPGTHHEAMIETLYLRGEYGTDDAARTRAERIKYQDRTISLRSIRTRPNGSITEVVSDPTPDGGWVVTFTDVTEDRRVRAELEKARVQAEAANRAKSRFLATMSHELRTPLNAVIGFSEVLTGNSTPEQIEEFSAAIQEAGRHLLSLIDDILDITRAESGSLPVVLETVPLFPLLDGAVRMIGPAVANGKLHFATDLPATLPRLSADGRRLRQVLLNLLSNAAKFTPAGGEIVLRARADASGLVIEVRDTGIGIEAKDMERVFEPFTQIDSALARRFPGSGLGLHLCRALIEAQGGTLVLESAPGIGTTARIAFPLDKIIEADRPGLDQHLA